MRPFLSIQDLSFTYRGSDRPALKNINIDIEEPAFIVLMGHGGSGKSTLCCSLNSLIPRFFRGEYQGRVLVKGKEVSRHTVPEMSHHVGMVLQDFESQLFSTNVELEMAFGPENHCLPRQEIGRRIEQYLAFVGLKPFRHREPASLSGGQKQRLAIGSVLSLEPEILVMDEPATDLDPVGREEVLSLADKFRQENRILLMVDQEPETGLSADQIWLMREGEVVTRGSPEEILPDLSRLKSCGIKPLPTIELFERMGWSGRPLTVESAISLIEKRHLIRQRRLFPTPLSLEGSISSPILSVEALRFIYPQFQTEALRDINLSINEGEFVALLGQNGSGKTTLAKHFNGLLKPSSGRVSVQGKSIAGYSHRELARLVGYVFQNPDHQIFARTVREEVGFGLKALGENPLTISKRVADALEPVELQGFEEKNPFALTRGERQRIAVASVLATQPRAIILDEPTTGLDYTQQKNMMEMLRHLNQRGHTIVIITHSMWVAAEYATRTIVMKDGLILADGRTRDIFANEVRLDQASLRPPSIVRLSNWLGTQALTVEQMVDELRKISNSKHQ
ncbi:MAG: energy-coupling factor ABC transporter ATP-binding protein [Deltaproteobacteria bacterium]|nr:energy-coupling factor ABC transporter ATP-binding protein [Deltaproteobacteria bacterium]